MTDLYIARRKKNPRSRDRYADFEFTVWGALPWRDRLALLFGADLNITFDSFKQISGISIPSGNLTGAKWRNPTRIGRWLNDRYWKKCAKKYELKCKRKV